MSALSKPAKSRLILSIAIFEITIGIVLLILHDPQGLLIISLGGLFLTPQLRFNQQTAPASKRTIKRQTTLTLVLLGVLTLATILCLAFAHAPSGFWLFGH